MNLVMSRRVWWPYKVVYFLSLLMLRIDNITTIDVYKARQLTTLSLLSINGFSLNTLQKIKINHGSFTQRL
jgi:hypothetical protein